MHVHLPSNILDIFLPAIKTYFQWPGLFTVTSYKNIQIIYPISYINSIYTALSVQYYPTNETNPNIDNYPSIYNISLDNLYIYGNQPHLESTQGTVPIALIILGV